MRSRASADIQFDRNDDARFRLFSVHRMVELKEGGRDQVRVIVLQCSQRRILERGNCARFVGYQRDIFRNPFAAFADGVEQNRRLVAEDHKECGESFRYQRADMGDLLFQSRSELLPRMRAIRVCPSAIRCSIAARTSPSASGKTEQI